MNVSDNEYEVEHNKRNRPEIPRGGGGKKKSIDAPIPSFAPHVLTK